MTRIQQIFLLAGALALVTAAGCKDRQAANDVSKAQGGGGAPAATNSNDVVATVNGEKITRAEIDKLIKPQMLELEKERRQAEYNLQQQAVNSLVMKKLVEAEVARRGVTQEQLFKTEVADKAGAPTQAEIKAFYDQNKARIQQSVPGATLQQVGGKIGEIVAQQKMQQTQQQFLQNLRQNAKIEIHLPEPEMPRVQIAADGPAKGPDTAPVTLIVFSDFQCPYCAKAKPILDTVKTTYGDKVRIVFRDFPLPIHPLAEKASEAGQCANEQGKFWELHDSMFAHQDEASLRPDGLKGLARQIPGIDAAKFDSCLDSGRMAAKVKANVEAGQEAGVGGTPSFFVNGEPVQAGSFDDLKRVIERELGAAGQKGRQG